jgi:hypothetical protein
MGNRCWSARGARRHRRAARGTPAQGNLRRGDCPDTDLKTNTVFGSTGGGVVNTGDNSLASEFSQKGLGNIDTDEVDPIAEAEVYLAYGRDAQAEEILKDALKKDPQRQEIYLKLLEIHAQHNKPSAFESVASELYSVSHGQGKSGKKRRRWSSTRSQQSDVRGRERRGDWGGMAAAGDSHTFSVPPDLKPPASSAPSHVAGNDNDNIFDRHLDADIARSSGAHYEIPIRHSGRRRKRAREDGEKRACDKRRIQPFRSGGGDSGVGEWHRKRQIRRSARCRAGRACWCSPRVRRRPRFPSRRVRETGAPACGFRRARCGRKHAGKIRGSDGARQTRF